MFKRLSLVQSIILVVLLSFTVAAWSVLLITDRQLRETADRSQSEVYAERIDKIMRYLKEKDQLLLATGLRDAYIDSFQDSALEYLGRVYNNTSNPEIYPVIQRVDGTMMLHPKIARGGIVYTDTFFFRTALRLRNGEFDYDYFGEPKWAIVRTFEPWGWIVAFAVPKKVKYRDVLALRTRLTVTLIGITLLTCIGVSFVIWRMTKPIRELTRAAQAISKGDLNFTTPVVGKGDISILAQAFVSMRASVRERIDSLHHEIQQRKRTERQLHEAKTVADHANQAKSLFLANMSHELRTPLNGVVGMLQLLGKTPLNSEQAKYTELGLLSCTRLMELLSNILDIARIEAGKIEILNDTFNLAETMQAVNHLFSSAANQANVHLSFELDPDIPVFLRGDAPKLQQILNNLVGNALKFTKQGKVAVCVNALPVLRQCERRLLFSVNDTGIGIADGKLTKLFEPFTQADDSFTKQYQGAGLGLSIVRRLVRLMRGTICVATEEGVGSTFFVCIPFNVEDANVQDAPPNINEVAITGKEQRVLLAEDDNVNAMVVVKHLEKLGHSVHVVVDGQQTIEALSKDDFDIIFMDIQMPVMDGVEATKRIRAGEAGEKKANIPIIALTAYVMVRDKEKFLKAGMNGYLAKPVDLDALLTVIEEVM